MPPAQRLTSSILPTVLKKSKASALEAEEFEEDVIEDLDDSTAPTSSSSSPTSTDQALSPEEAIQQRHETVYARLSTEAAKSAFYLRSNIPRSSRISSLLMSTTLPTLDRSLDLIALLRQKVPVVLAPRAVFQELVDRFLKLGKPETIVRVLEDRQTFGFDLKDMRIPQKVSWVLAQSFERKPGSNEDEEEVAQEKKRALENSFKLLALTQLYLPEAMPNMVLSLFTLHTAVKAGGMKDPRAEKLVEELKAFGAKELVDHLTVSPTNEEVAKLGNAYIPPSVRLTRRVSAVLLRLEKYYKERLDAGDDCQAEVTFFTEVLTPLREGRFLKEGAVPRAEQEQ